MLAVEKVLQLLGQKLEKITPTSLSTLKPLRSYKTKAQFIHNLKLIYIAIAIAIYVLHICMYMYSMRIVESSLRIAICTVHLYSTPLLLVIRSIIGNYAENHIKQTKLGG